MKGIKVVSLPLNTSLIWPLDKGVIKTFKAHDTESLRKDCHRHGRGADRDHRHRSLEGSPHERGGGVTGRAVKATAPETGNSCWRKLSRRLA